MRSHEAMFSRLRSPIRKNSSSSSEFLAGAVSWMVVWQGFESEPLKNLAKQAISAPYVDKWNSINQSVEEIIYIF